MVGGITMILVTPTNEPPLTVAQFLALQTDIVGGSIDAEELHVEMERPAARDPVHGDG